MERSKRSERFFLVLLLISALSLSPCGDTTPLLHYCTHHSLLLFLAPGCLTNKDDKLSGTARHEAYPLVRRTRPLCFLFGKDKFRPGGRERSTSFDTPVLK